MLLTGTFSRPRPSPDDPALTPPIAAKRGRAKTKFGDRRVDNYRWMRDKDDPAVVAYLEAENAYRSESVV